ncbi:MAG: hypothetical protein JW797_08235 [Bradymonadales bacterium]|nr:hypothetical protein [Bradymonadales bacterium]
MNRRKIAFISCLVSIGLGIGLLGCTESGGTSFTTDWRAVFPTASDVELRIPSDPVPSGLLVGETALFYSETYRQTRAVNGMVYVILSVLGDIAALPPTSYSQDQAVWGPYTPALEPAAFRLSATRVAPGEYRYVLQARPRASSSEEDWVDLIAGEAFPSGDRNGHGRFSLDWTSLHELNGNSTLVGQMEVSYDHRPLSFRSVEVLFTDLADLGQNPEGEPLSGTYRYQEADDTSGEFQFAYLADLYAPVEELSLPETVQVRSRWTDTGEGRSDVRVSGVEVAEVLGGLLDLEQEYVQVSECWDDLFLRTWYDETPVRLTADDGEPEAGSLDGPGQGDPATCPFDDTLYADDDIDVM